MRIGVHVRRGNGLEHSVRKAAEIGCETIQVFAANPSAWHTAPIKPALADSFRHLTEKLGLFPVFVHTPYLLNLASPDAEIHSKSVVALEDSMSRASLLGAQYVVTHIGSHRGTNLHDGVARVSDGLSQVLRVSASEVILLLENSAGAGDSVGHRFEDLRMILDNLPEYNERLGICLDTAHLWGAGYDVSSQDSVSRTLDEFDSVVGFRWLRQIHLNDTNVALGSRRDRHANIGTGNIGEAGFAAILRHPAVAPLAGIIETPARSLEDDIHDIDILRRLRGEAR